MVHSQRLCTNLYFTSGMFGALCNLLPTGLFGGNYSKSWKMDPEMFVDNFKEDSHPRSTDLLYEIQWEGGRRTYKNFCTNEHPIHAEVNFLENEWRELMMHRRYRTTPCDITWFLSWSPCGKCSNSIVDFLVKHPYVTLEIRAARLYRDYDERNRSGLRNLDQSGVTINIMDYDDFSYCWDTFVDQERDEDSIESVFSEDLYRTYSDKLERILNPY